ncbi:MAG: glycyl radical protein [Firmicutes bacterium]|nr:glycyl radical protein [Bacillota bacterium]
MTERVRILRQQSLETIPSITDERARLLTEFYKQVPVDAHPVPIHRALAFKYILEHKEICINPGELIVGERGPGPKVTPTYPELCCHSLEDLDLLHNREKIPFTVSESVRNTYAEEIIPFWQGRSMRDRIFAAMTQEWKDCYESGIYTEFMEQRAPGHTVADEKVFTRGFLDFKAEIAESLASLDWLNDPRALDKSEQLKAMDICADAIIIFARRHADVARRLAETESDPRRRWELEQIAANCERVPAHAPENFWQALQGYWFVHLCVITELNTWDSFNPGRLDQHLWPFYQKETESGVLDKEQARELLQCFWVKFNNQPAPPKVGVTAAESGTYTDFANINSGGLRPDGSDGVNEVSYLVLDVIDEMQLLQPSSNIQLSKKNPDRFLKHACRVIRKGWGQPSIFNADSVVQELINQGKSLVDARCGGTSGCVETGAFGKEAYILTGYFNLPKVLEVVLHNGRDPETKKQIGLQTGDPRSFASFDELMDAYKRQLNHFIDIKIRGNHVIERLYARDLPCPFLSLIIDDCIKTGTDYNAGGARYNTNYIQGVGIGTVTDSLAAIKDLVYDKNLISMDALLAALADNLSDQRIRLLLQNKPPKYGNDDDAADELMVEVFRIFYQAVDGRETVRGGTYRINMLPTTCHVYFGSRTGATPDGRVAHKPFSEGISPVQGADRNGPTAAVKSAAKMDHLLTGGTLLNQKFTPQVLAGEEGIEKLTRLVRSYFKLDGHHIQFNVVDVVTLQAAQEDPQAYRDLIVRVAGYSDYFCDLSKELQDEIIARTEHSAI